MKRIVSCVLFLLLLVSLTSCSDGSVSIDTVVWEVRMGTTDSGKSVMVAEFTNNSDYTITEIDLVFSMKDDIDKETLDEFYSYVQEEYFYTDADMEQLKQQKISMTCRVNLDDDEYLKSGEKCVDEVHYGGFTYVLTMDYYDLFEPKSYEIEYLDENGEDCEMEYNYFTKTYKEDK